MKFTIKKKNILQVLQKVNAGIPKNTTLQVLKNFKLVLENNTLSITATDLDLTIVKTIIVQGEKNGSVLIDAGILIKSLKNCPFKNLTFLTEEYDILVIKTKTFNCKIQGLNIEEYPITELQKIENKIILSYEKLKFLFEKTKFAVSNNYTSRVSLTGIFWEFLDDKLNFVTTDGHRFSKAWCKFKNDMKIPNIIIQPKAIAEVLKNIKDKNAVISIYLGDILDDGYKKIQFISEDFEITSRLVDEIYPDYQTGIPNEYEFSIDIDKKELNDKIKLVTCFAHIKTKCVVLKFENNELQISSEYFGQGVQANETLPINYKKDEFIIGVNGEYFIENLNLIDTEKVTLKFKNNLTGFKITNISSSKFYMYLWPLRVDVE